MTYYFIYAYPEMYGGLHGMYIYDLVKCSNYEEACSIGRDMAREVIESYGLEEEIYSEESYMEEFDTNVIDDEYYDILNEEIEEQLGYEIYLLKDEYNINDYIKWQEENRGPIDFIKNYCRKFTEKDT